MGIAILLLLFIGVRISPRIEVKRAEYRNLKGGLNQGKTLIGARICLLRKGER